MYQRYFKRFFDFIIGTSLLLILSPLILCISIILMIVNGGKTFFFQNRPGLNCKPFTIIKFKTMNDKKDHKGDLLPNHERITPLGSFLREYSIDEIPQLINVIMGNMSLVGPRPLLFKYIPLYRNNQIRRHDVKPGITGWAQVNGRNAITWTKKFQYDLWYVDNISLKLDIKIIYLTLIRVIKRDSINKSEKITSEPFNGLN